MSYATRVLQAMQYDQVYDAATISSITRIDQKSSQAVLHQLGKAGMLEVVQNDRFRKNRKYKTKQKTLFN